MRLNINFDHMAPSTLGFIEDSIDMLFNTPNSLFLHNIRNPRYVPPYMSPLIFIEDTPDRLTAQAAVAMIASLRYQTLIKEQ